MTSRLLPRSYAAWRAVPQVAVKVMSGMLTERLSSSSGTMATRYAVRRAIVRCQGSLPSSRARGRARRQLRSCRRGATTRSTGCSALSAQRHGGQGQCLRAAVRQPVHRPADSFSAAARVCLARSTEVALDVVLRAAEIGCLDSNLRGAAPRRDRQLRGAACPSRAMNGTDATAETALAQSVIHVTGLDRARTWRRVTLAAVLP